MSRQGAFNKHQRLKYAKKLRRIFWVGAGRLMVYWVNKTAPLVSGRQGKRRLIHVEPGDVGDNPNLVLLVRGEQLL